MQLICLHNSFRSPKILSVQLIVVMLLFSAVSFSQEKKKIEILKSGYGEKDETLEANAQRLVDNVLIRHKETLMWCDTAIIYSGSSKVRAIGNIHINKGDTLHLYADNLFFDSNISIARAWDNVVLVDKTTKLYADTLDFDTENNICYYDDFGRIEDSTTTITSTIGEYFIDDNNIFFYKNVKGYNEDFTLESDTVKYNTETGKMIVNGPTTIRDSVNTLYAEEGWYNSITGETELKKNVSVYNSKQRLNAQYVKYNKVKGTGKARGSVRMEDMENRSIILGNVADYNDELQTAMVTDSAVYMTYTEKDTLYLHADTLRTTPDTIEGEKIITAHYGVRFFRTDMQGLCDSLVYFTNDSIIQLHYHPILWSENHQLSAKTIEIRQITDGPNELRLTTNSFIISKQDSGMFDQIKGKEMIGYIVDQKLKKIDVNGNGETLYYAQEKEEILGLNRLEGGKISILFKKGKIYRLIFFKSPVGELKPLLELTDADKELKGFDWKIGLRPRAKYDIFPRDEISPDDLDDNMELKK